ncbi:MAG: dephospho-CoA kinase [Lachnospiraceae bacterium]|nr:dephospho-CoA kinase [Lachnospiraceae bacterium]
MIIGVTGGVGAGKSTILDYLKSEYHAYIIMADDVAKDLMNLGQTGYDAVVSEFGSEILDADKMIDRPKLSSIVFNNDEKLERLNNLIHPLVKDYILEKFDFYRTYIPDRIVVLEAALLIEEGYKEFVDELWAVITNTDVRIQRLKETRGYSEEKARSIIDNQLSNEEFAANSDFVINNSYGLEATQKQIKDHLDRIINQQ